MMASVELAITRETVLRSTPIHWIRATSRWLEAVCGASIKRAAQCLSASAAQTKHNWSNSWSTA